MPVIKDVARLAGVSPSTVSKYLNTPDELTDTYRERVASAIDELGYKPSPVARSLRTQKTNTIALVVPDVVNPFYTDIYTSVHSAAREYGYTTILYNTDESFDVMSELLTEMAGRHVDGAIICFADEDENIPQLEDIQTNLPITLISWDINNTKFNSVIINLFDSVYQSTKHLVSLGHKDIAYINGPSFSRVSKEKLGGFQKAMADAGLSFSDEYVFQGKYRYQTGFRGAMQFMNSPKAPTAIVCANDILAIGCIKFLVYNGYRVPEDVAVTGLDGTQISYVYDPSISTMCIPVDDMCHEAVRLLADKIARPNSKNRQVIFDTKLNVRMSTKKDAPLMLDL